MLLGYFFYRSLLGTVMLVPLLIPYYFREKKKAEERYRHLLGLQFRDMLLSVSNSQKAGYSVENAFLESRRDMKQLHGRNSPICRELERIAKGLSNNVVLEQLLYEFGERARHPDIREFAQVFAVAKRSGGNMTQMMEGTISLIGDRMEVEKEIDVLISAKRMEARIMEVIPFGIICYVGACNPGFFDPLYHNLPGILLMTACLGCYVVSYVMAEKIIDIQVA